MLVNIFCEIDDFCKFLNKEIKLIGENSRRKMSLSEVITIVIYYHYSGYKTFKDYYLKHVKINLNQEFKNLVSYNRFIEIMKEAIMPIMLYIKIKGFRTCTGISIIDSFSLKVCHAKRESSNKTFKNKAKKGKTSVGWFFGFKIHLVINHNGKIIDFDITPGNISDNNKTLVGRITKNVKGRLLADKGYIGLFKYLYSQGIELIHKIRSNMKNKLVLLENKFLLKKRGVIESVINILKNTFNIEHSRHRSTSNFLTNTLSALAAYCFKPNKPSFDALSVTTY